MALGFGIVFFMSAITFGSTIAQSVVEEKQTRVVEILLSTVPVRALLAGKVIGNSVLAIGQIVAIAIIAIGGLMVTGQRVLIGGLGASVLWFVVFFLVGFVMLAALFAATASLVSRAEDVGSVTSPVTMLVMIPYFLVIFFNDNATVLAIMSYIPFSAPVGMPMRIFLGQAEWWEPFLSLGILARHDRDRALDRRARLLQLAAQDGRPREAGRGDQGLRRAARFSRAGAARRR